MMEDHQEISCGKHGPDHFEFDGYGLVCTRCVLDGWIYEDSE